MVQAVPPADQGQAQTSSQFSMPAQYMFKDVPQTGQATTITWHLDRRADGQATISSGRWSAGTTTTPRAAEAKAELYGDRFFFDLPIDPNRGMKKSGGSSAIHAEVGLSSRELLPRGHAIRKWRSTTNTCSRSTPRAPELGLPILLNVGIPGPRIPMETQKVEHLDEVCWFFPELKVVMRHGAEPWEAWPSSSC